MQQTQRTTERSAIEAGLNTQQVLAEEPTPRKPFGPVAAAFISAGIGAFVFGVLTVTAELNTGFATAITISPAVGPLSGKVIWAVVAYAAAWLVMGFALRARDFSEGVAFITTGALFGGGFLLAFPPVWHLLGAP